MRLFIYTSQYCGSSGQIEQDIHDIVTVSKQHNPAAQITGVLFFLNGHFLQALEGGDEAVAGLIERLQGDARHRDMQTLVDIPIPRRHFQDWNMDCLNLDKTELFTSETLLKLHNAYSKNVQVNDAGFVSLLEDMLNTPGVEEALKEAK